jgi:dCMP deaminase
MHRLDWDQYFMALAKLAALRSGCNSRPTGAVIVDFRRVIATGYNGTLPGQPQCTDRGHSFCHRRSTKLCDKGEGKYQECPSIHAEQNALNQLARQGGSNGGALHVYCTLQPCIFCLKNMRSVGVTRVCYELDYRSDDSARDDAWRARAKEYGIAMERIEFSVDDISVILNSFKGYTSARKL